MDVDQVIEQLQGATDEDRAKILEALFPESERRAFARSLANSSSVNSAGAVLSLLNAALERCRCQAAGVQ